jgi:hypothetical protein
MAKQSQNKQILGYLQTGRTLSSLQALSLFRCMRLASRINDLRRDGHQIITDIVYQNDKHWANYRLIKPIKRK